MPNPDMNSLSVIIPLYNVSPYLETTLDSIARQTLRDFEVILVDDGSTDGTYKIAEHYCRQHPTWQLISQQCQGVSVARNVGTLQAKGDYVVYVDGDDWLMPQTLQALLYIATQAQADLVQCGFFYAYDTHLLYDSRRQHPSGEKQYFNTENALIALCQQQPLLNNFLWAKLIRRDIALDCPNPPGKVAQDAFVMHEIVSRCKKLVTTPQPLWYYRQRSTGLSGHFSVKRKDLLEAYEVRIKFCQQTHREHLLKEVVPEYIHQIFLHRAAARRSQDKATALVFEQYAQEARKHYASLFKTYAPYIWLKSQIKHLSLINFSLRAKQRLSPNPMLRYSYSEVIEICAFSSPSTT